MRRHACLLLGTREPFAILRPGQTMSDEARTSVKTPTLFRNYISFAGAVIVAASLASIVLLFLIELTKGAENPYLGIVTYIILPGCLILGLVIIAAGMFVERRRRRRWPESEIAAYPRIDLNDPRERRVAFSLVGVSFIFIFMS